MNILNKILEEEKNVDTVYHLSDIKGKFQCDNKGAVAKRFQAFLELPKEERCQDCENSEYFKKCLNNKKWKDEKYGI